MSKVAVIGLGYVGICSAVALVKLGHEVLAVDTDINKLNLLSQSIAPIYEPGLDLLLAEMIDTGRLEFSNCVSQVGQDIDFAFVCVPTPSEESGAANLVIFHTAIDQLIERLRRGSIVVVKSTVPIGTGAALTERLEKHGIGLVVHPEFLSEGSAINDVMNPTRLVIGSSDAVVAVKVAELYEGEDYPIVMCDPTSAEAIKYASNSFLAIKISFANELSALAEKSGADVNQVLFGMGLDPRIGQDFLRPGPGWGGSCFPKDTAELAHLSKTIGVEMLSVRAAIESNRRTKARIVELLRAMVGGEFEGKRIAVWGLTFKANTDDTRDSPAIEIALAIESFGAQIRAYDPRAKTDYDKKLGRVPSALDACRGADALVVLTDWREFQELEPSGVRSVMNEQSSVFDARNILDEKTWAVEFQKFQRIGK